ncbi:hypothetical protein CLIB1423_04S02542 [[Candida] railenensis]|uniref:WD40 repeat-like protein n=1 Tax=[Candida] railenensis TaxID=45579 RepID=A0A9P0VXM7_9ASCO|nr:hypothetical protein CLIB1423_04S02542 [[Candida] railenensis]
MVCLHFANRSNVSRVHLGPYRERPTNSRLDSNEVIIMIDETEILANGSSNLPINKILGSSIKSPSLFTVQDDVVAYTAGSGIVVSKLDKVKGNVISQRFFCVNSKQDAAASANPYAPSSANAYLNMIKKEIISPSTNEESFKADSFGYPFETIISGSSSDNHLDSNPKVENSGSITFDVNTSSPSKFKDRVRSISCLSISPNKSILAIGEIGYHPRIALFSLAPDSSSSPIALVYEHSFGINSISFAPDSRTFSSLGLLNDGFLNIWRFNTNPSGYMESIQLQASNKCTSVVNKLIWHENYLITLGLRMVKVWKYEERRNNNSFNNMALKGKNVLLGQLINSNFIEGESLSADEVIIMTDNSQILLLKLQYDNLKLITLDSASITKPFHTMCIDYLGEKVWFGCKEGKLETLRISELKESTGKVKAVEQPTNSKLATMLNSPLNPNHSNSNSSLNGSSDTSNNLVLKVFDYDSDTLLVYTPSQELKLIGKVEQSKKVIVSSLLKNLSGIKNTYSKELLVFSKEGIIKKIDYENHYKESIISTLRLPSNELIPNCLTAVDKLNEKVLACGDKHGNIYVGASTDEETLSIEYQIKAHTSSVNEVIFFEGTRNYYMCSISRDRMIQIFKKSKSDVSGWDILQTLPTHSANILRVFNSNDKLYTCSSDRTISIHSIVEDEGSDKVTVVQEKIISLKNTPITMKLYGNDLIVSTSDKVLLIYKINGNFELKRSLKLINASINESLLIENFVVHNNVIIASSSDKSLRIFNYQSGKPIAVYWGHSDSILSLKLVSNFNELLSISLDGCLFKWNLKSQRTEEVARDQSRSENELKNLEYVPLYAKVTRKIIPNVVTAPSSTRTPTRSRRSSLSSSPTREEKDQSISPPTPTVPRLLSAATLKRIETRTESKSPSKQQQQAPQLNRSLSSSPTKASNRYSWSPTKSSTPTHKKRMSLDNVTNKLTPSAVIHEKSDTNLFMERSISHLTMMKSNLFNVRLEDDEKLKLKTMLKDLHDILSDEKIPLEGKENGLQSNKENEILELYSDKLINMFQTKLQLVEKNNNLSTRSISRASTEGIFKRIYSNDLSSNEVE